MRVIDFLTDAATKPAVTADKANEVKPLPATPTDGTLVGETSGSGAAGGTPAQAGTHP